jgi:hypothetical protein
MHGYARYYVKKSRSSPPFSLTLYSTKCRPSHESVTEKDTEGNWRSLFEEHRRDPQSGQSVSSQKKGSSKLLNAKKHADEEERVKELHGVHLRSC